MIHPPVVTRISARLSALKQAIPVANGHDGALWCLLSDTVVDGRRRRVFTGFTEL